MDQSAGVVVAQVVPASCVGAGGEFARHSAGAVSVYDRAAGVGNCERTMSTLREQIETYRLDIREKAARIVDDVHRAKRISARKRDEAILRMCEVLWRQECA